MNDLSGTQLGQYQLIEVIGKGGMAVVYRAHQTSINRDVAIKIISTDLASDPEFMARFEREAQIIAKLQHPHILPVYDFGHENGLTYLVIRLMEGGSLAHELQAGRLPSERVLELTRQIASALDYAHLRGIVHRDLKPTNVLLDDLGNAYLTDFGIAKLLSGGPTTGLTATGAVMGTPTYMAPEQWKAEPVDGRTDVYALGVMIYQMLLGQVPFSAETPHGLMYQHLDVQPPAPHTIDPSLPLAVEPVIARALAKHREDRYASAGDLALDLEKALHAPRRLPEQTDFEAKKVEVTATEIGDPYAPLYEDELMALADESEKQDLQPTIPPTAASAAKAPPAPARMPPPYVPPPVVLPPAATAPVYQPYAAPPPSPMPRPYERAAGTSLGRWLWMIAAMIVGVAVLVGVVLIGASLLSSGNNNNPASPTPPPPPPSATSLYRPSVLIEAPANNTGVVLGSTVTIQFTARDVEGITRVELRRFNRTLQTIEVGNQQVFQGSFIYQADSTGTHTLEVLPWRGDVRGDPASVTIIVQ